MAEDAIEKYKKVYQDAVSFQENALVKVPEEEVESFNKYIKGLKEASGMAKDEEAWSYLAFASVRHASAIAFKLFRLGELKDDLETQFKALPTPEEAVKAPKEFNDKHKEESDRMMKEQNEFAEKAQERELFQAVCNGMPLKEAKQKQADYNAQAQAALGR